MDWNDLRYFLAVARTTSLTEAARQLLTSPSTVARHVQTLEEALKAKLFDKSPEGYQLTDAGRALYEPAIVAEAQMLWIARDGANLGDVMAGTVSLGVPELLGTHMLIPAMKEFQTQHPAIRFEISADVRLLSLSRKEADVVVRLSRPTQGDYLTRLIGSIGIGLFGSTEYITKFGSPDDVSDLGQHKLIGWEAGFEYLSLARWLAAKAPDSGAYIVRTHTMTAQLAAANAGLGLAVLPSFVAKQHGLTRVLRNVPPLELEIWLLHSGASLRVKAVADHISGTIAAAAPFLMNLD